MPSRMLTVLPAIYDAATTVKNWQNALDEFATASGAKSASLYANNNHLFEFQIQTASSYIDNHSDVLRTYLEKFADHELHAVEHMKAAPAFKRVEDDDIWPGFAEMSDREDLRFLAREMGIFRRVGYNLSTSPAWGAFVALQFDESVTEFHPTWVSNSDILTHHMGKALDINRFCSQLQQQYQAVLTVFNRVDVALCLCLPNGEVVVQNNRAKEVFSDGNGIEISRSGQLRMSDQDLTARVRAYISECGRTAAGVSNQPGREVSVGKRNRTEPYFLEVSPIRDGADELNEDFVGAMVMIIDPENLPRFSTNPVAKIFGLTVAEADVAELLVTGTPLGEIAEIRGVSLETIRTQSKRIHAKVGTRTRAELVRKTVNVSPPILRT